MYSTLAFAIFAAACTVAINAHGSILVPRPTFKDGIADITNFNAAIDGKTLFADYVAYDGWGSVAQNAVRFKELFDQTQKYPDIRTIVDAAVPDCGNTVENGPRQAVADLQPANVLQWRNDGSAEAFTPSHAGPCEIWIDNVRVFQNDDCANAPQDIIRQVTTASGPTAEIPMDYSACVGDCMLRFYWLALQEQNIQYYKNCVPLAGNADAAAYTAPVATQVTPAPVAAPVTETPVPAVQETVAPVAVAETLSPVTQAPYAIAETLAPATQAPTVVAEPTTGVKCARRFR